MVVGKVQMHNKDYYNAEMQFRDIIELDKNFMPGYDSLAEVMKLTENFEEAQTVLMDAVKVSPKSILRQRSLADVLDVNGEKELLEKTRKKVVDIGKSSSLKKPTDYTKLAKAYVGNNSPNKAIDILGETGKVFRGDDEVVLGSKVQLADVYKQTNNSAMYKEAVDASLKLVNKNKQLAKGEIAIELARACIDLDKTDEAKELVSSVVKDYSDDEDIMATIVQMYADAGMAEEGEQLISTAKDEVIKINNEGVGLIKEGKISEAINLFQMAVREMPNNITVNLNVAMALYLNMKNTGFNERTQKQVFEYLDTIFERDTNNAKALDLRSKCLLLAK